MARKKITVVGAGNVGAAVAHGLTLAELGDVVLLDVVEGLPQGKALDLAEATPMLGCNVSLTGTNRFEETADSDIVIVTAGLTRKPGMSRSDLLGKNAEIVSRVVEGIAPGSPNAILILVTNPLDTMTYLAMRTSGFPRQRVLGMAGVLDTARYRAFVAMELGVSVEDVTALVLGGHGDTMVPLPRLTLVGGVPLEELLDRAAIERIVQRTRDGGIEIAHYLKTGTAHYAPAASTIQMAQAILKDQKRILPCSVYLQGEYGLHDVFVGVPALLGAGGVERIFEVRLTEEESEALEFSAHAVRKEIAMLAIEEGFA